MSNAITHLDAARVSIKKTEARYFDVVAELDQAKQELTALRELLEELEK